MTRVPAVLISDFPDRDAVVRESVRRWSGDDVLVEHVSDGASFTYRFVVQGERRYLRLTPPGWRSRAEIDGELAFIDHLDAKGIALARPIASAGGERVEAIDSGIGECLALVFEEITGDAEDDVHWSPEQAREAGRLMARMHIAAYDFALPPGAARLSWRDELLGLKGELPPSEAGLWAMIDETAGLFDRLPKTPECYGMVHFDLSGDNVVWRGLTPTVIDFDDCMTHWYIADITRSISYFREQARDSQEIAFIEGYRELRDIDADWTALMPAFLRLALISELAWMMFASHPVARGVEFTSEDEANLRRLIRACGDE